MRGSTCTRRSLLAGSVALAIGSLETSQVIAQEPSWRLVTPASEGPTPRWDHSLAPDPSGESLLLFGGRDNDGNALDDTWRFDVESTTWTRVEGEGPSARFGSTVGVSPDGGSELLFGGQAGADFFNDTWRFDLGTDQWVLENDGSIDAPAPRYGLGSAMTPEGRFVISHGFTFEGRFDDTWEYGTESGQWSNITPPDVRPLNRCLHEMVAVSSSAMLLYGGCSSGFGPCPQGDLWRFDIASGTWMEITPGSGPTARTNPSLVWVESAGAAWLFGGQTDSGKSAELWTGSLSDDGFGWEQVSLQSTGPSARSSHDAVVLGDAMWVFGGLTEAGAANDLWVLTT